MPIISCSSCGQKLNIGDNLAGARVRCPGCKTVFQAPAAAPKTAPIVVSPVQARAAAAPPDASDNPFEFGVGSASSAPALAFDFQGSEESTAQTRLVKAQVQAAASWLTYAAGTEIAAVALAMLAVTILASLARGGGGKLAVLLLGSLCAAACLAAPVTFMLVGARCFRAKTSYGLAMTGGIFAAINAAGLILVSFACIALGPGGMALSTLLLGAAGTAVTAAVKTFKALANRDVKEAFRIRRGLATK